MIAPRDLSMAKMNALRHIVEIHRHNCQQGQIDLKAVVEDADKLVSWILNPACKYIVQTEKEKETK